MALSSHHVYCDLGAQTGCYPYERYIQKEQQSQIDVAAFSCKCRSPFKQLSKSPKQQVRQLYFISMTTISTPAKKGENPHTQSADRMGRGRRGGFMNVASACACFHGDKKSGVRVLGDESCVRVHVSECGLVVAVISGGRTHLARCRQQLHLSVKDNNRSLYWSTFEK